MQKLISAPSRKLKLVPLVAATYFMVAGGPYGLEELIQTSGYKLGLLIVLFVPVIWSLPTALMVGELSAAIPCDGGFYVWVQRALGRFWGFQESWLSLMASAFDLAAYPTLFVLSLGQLWSPATQGYNGVMIATGMLVACMLWNLFGAKAVGDGSVLLGVLLLCPFVAITIAALFRHSVFAAQTATVSPAKGGFLSAIIVAMWNYMGWDNASTVAGEVENPQKTYPRVMMITLAVIVISYMIPIAAVWYTHLAPTAWSTGSWSKIASMVVGPWLGIALLIGSMISTFGIVNSLTLSYSRLPLAMAEAGDAPKIFERKLPSGAPWVSIVACGLLWSTMLIALKANFDRLLMLDILLYGASLVLEFIALVVLRMREPQLVRPFKVPGGLPVAALLGVGPTVLLVMAFIKNRNEQLGPISSLNLGLLLMAAGVVCYFITAWRRNVGAREASASQSSGR
ncbi:MAG TPA: APC family permease [Candidatus Angelobacter sp.]|nr:APC family permease [Candidatus Angelobacter sp.]